MNRTIPHGIFAVLLFVSLLASAHADLPEQPASKSIPWSEIGARAGAQYEGDGLAIVRNKNDALIHSTFQRLRGEATSEGLWLISTVEGAASDRFRVVATTIGRHPSSNIEAQALPATGRIESDGDLVRFVRPGLIEEYSTSMDGVRQDFLVQKRPEGEGELRIELAVDGARAENVDFGARLALKNSGRHIAYSRLRVEDAEGRILPARIEIAAADRLAIFVADAGAVYPVRIDPTFSDENWISMGGGLPGANGEVLAAVVSSDGTLFVGGNFTVIGDVLANGIARWDGTAWSALGSGMSGTVSALAVSGDDLYAGGEFTTADGVRVNNIARWDGSAWSTLGSGMGGSVSALAVSGDGLYAGGDFTWAGGVYANRIARWDGSSWSRLRSGMSGTVSALAVSGDDLYAGGEFTTAGGVTVNNIARWDGTAWSALGSGMSREVFALAVSGNDLYAGGFFQMGGGIARWNGTYWSALGSGIGAGHVRALVVSGGDLYVGGVFTSVGVLRVNNVARWDGSSWSALDSGTNRRINALAVSGSNLYAGGDFTMARGVTMHIARWDGNSWSALGSGMGEEWSPSIRALAISEEGVFAGGEFTTAGGAVTTSIGQWNGISWAALGSGMNSKVSALTFSGGDLYAAGFFTMAGGVSANRIARWDGNSWSALGSGMNSAISALAVSGGDLYAAGSFTWAGGVSANRIARWDGSSWSALGSGMAWGHVRALALSGSDLYAGGSFTMAGGVTVNYIARWDGSAWSALGSGVSGAVSALAVSEDYLYAGGSFGVVRWDGNSWSALGTGIKGGWLPWVHTLAVCGDDLYAGGRFTTAGGVRVKNIARWNGSAWSRLGSGMNSDVATLVVSDADLYAGGHFTLAGGKVAAYLAKTDIAVSLSDGVVTEQRQPGAVVGSLSAIEIGEANGPTVFTLVSGPGDDDNASFTIDGELLKTSEVFDYDVQNLFTIRVRATYANGTRAEKVFLLQVNPDGFLVWANALPLDQRGKMDDPGGRGIPNLLRYAFGMDPLDPDRAALPQHGQSEVTVEGQPQLNLTLTYTRRTDDPDLIFTPEGSNDASTWTPLTVAEEVTDSSGTTETVVLTDPEPMDARPKGFLRVRVEKNQ